jgi:predicted cobalt transporter CbtA
MRFSTLLRNGAIAGAVGGFVAGLVQWLHTEPVIRRALAIEEARDRAAGHHEVELVSRTAQVFWGAFAAAVAGVLFGLVFAVVFARTRQRLPGLTDHSRALWLAVFGFCAFALMPALAIPANPPSVGGENTVTQRTLIYVLSILVGLLVIGVVSAIDRLLRAREVDLPLRLSAVIVATAVLVPLALWALPSSPDRIPADVPAALIWDFRTASLAQLATMWVVMGLVFGLLAVRRTSAVREAVTAAR